MVRQKILNSTLARRSPYWKSHLQSVGHVAPSWCISNLSNFRRKERVSEIPYPFSSSRRAERKLQGYKSVVAASFASCLGAKSTARLCTA